MAKTKDQKKKTIAEYKKKLESSKGFIVLKPNRLTPNEINEFRKEIYDFGSNVNVVKNTLFKIALKEANLGSVDLGSGEYSILFLGDNYIDTAKSLKKFIENAKTKDKEDKVTVVLGKLENSDLTKDQVMQLSEMPDLKTSIAMILGILDNAMSGVVNVLEDAPRSFVTVLDLAFKE